MGIGLKGFISKKLNKNYFIKEKILGAVQDFPVLHSQYSQFPPKLYMKPLRLMPAHFSWLSFCLQMEWLQRLGTNEVYILS